MGAPATANGTERKGGKGKGKGKKKGNEEVPVNIQMLTLMLRTAATVSRHQSYLVQAVLMPMESIIGKRAIDAEESYRDKTNGKKGHGIGKPDTYIFFRMLDGAQQMLKGHEGDKKIDAFFQSHVYGKPKEYSNSAALQLCRASVTYKGDQFRIGLRIVPIGIDTKTDKLLLEAYMVLCECMKQDGGEVADGPPPKSKEERDLQKVIHKHWAGK